MSDWCWWVEGDGPWPSFDIDPEELMDLLDEFDKYWPAPWHLWSKPWSRAR